MAKRKNKPEPKPKLKSKAKAKPKDAEPVKDETPVEAERAPHGVWHDCPEQADPPPKRIEVRLPVPHDCPPDVVVVPVKLDPAKVVPLAEVTPPVHCVATLVCGWREDYIVLSAAPGHRLPPIKETGTEVNVQFSPPALPSAPEPEPRSEPKPPETAPADHGTAG